MSKKTIITLCGFAIFTLVTAAIAIPLVINTDGNSNNDLTLIDNTSQSKSENSQIPALENLGVSGDTETKYIDGFAVENFSKHWTINFPQGFNILDTKYNENLFIATAFEIGNNVYLIKGNDSEQIHLVFSDTLYIITLHGGSY